MSSAENIVLTVKYIITMLVSLIGNILLLYIVWKKPDVRSLTSFMFVNMAVADLLVTLVVIPYTISDFYTHGVWSMTGLIGQITCKTVIYIAFFTITTSILCLTFMAVDSLCSGLSIPTPSLVQKTQSPYTSRLAHVNGVDVYRPCFCCLAVVS